MPEPHTLPLTLTVDPRGKVLLCPELLIALGIKHGAAIELLPPRQRNGGRWHLDVRATANRRLTHTRHTYPCFQTGYQLSPRHFGWGRYNRLTLVLDLAPPEHPGYYALRPCLTLSPPAHVPQPAPQ